MAPVHPRFKARNAKSKRSFSNNVPPGLHYLPPLDPKSDEFLELFRSFLTSKDERKNIVELSVEDGRVFIDLIDKAFLAATLDKELKGIAIGVLTVLCGKTGHLPGSYLLSDKFDLSGQPYASGGFSDVRMGVFKGKDVAVKSLRISEMDNKGQIRRRFCKEVAMWKNLCHPNVLNLIGIPDTLEDGRFSMVTEWMVNGDIMGYVRRNSGNHLKLLADAVEGLRYLHHSNIVHGDLKGASILITNSSPASACLAHSRFMIPMYDPSLEIEPWLPAAYEAAIPFMAPEVLVPYKFGLPRCMPSMEADVYAMAMAIYQVLTGTAPFGNFPGPKVVLKVLGGDKPPRPGNPVDLGLSDELWKLLEGCWETERKLRPSVKDLLVRVKSAAVACGVLPRVNNAPWGFTDPGSLKLKAFGPPFSRTPASFRVYDRNIPGPPPSGSIKENNIGLIEEEFDTGPPIEVHKVVSALKSRNGAKQLERDEAQKYANILDASLGNGVLDNQAQTQYLGCLKRLCGTLGILPASFILAGALNGHGVAPFASGGHGSVRRMSFGGRRVAVKTLHVTQAEGGLKRIYKLLAREVVAWKWLEHKNILPFIGVTLEFAIVSEFMENGNIMKFIAENPTRNRLHLLIGAAHGLEYLHSHNIVHGDLKGANILIDSTNSACLADFGLATIIGESTAGSTAAGYEPKGTTRWMAPEILHPEQFEFPSDARKQLPSKSTDIYALGMTTLEVLTGKRPYDNISGVIAVILEVMSGRKPDRPAWGFSDGLWNLLMIVWEPEYGDQPPKRPSIQTISEQMREDAGRWDQFIAYLQQQVEEDEATPDSTDM